MNNSNKDANLKEKLKQALSSTFKVISDDYLNDTQSEKNKSSKKIEFFELDNLNSINDFIKARAETDSSALKKKFSNVNIYKENVPLNKSCRSLYSIAEKIRYECLGSKILRELKKI